MLLLYTIAERKKEPSLSNLSGINNTIIVSPRAKNCIPFREHGIKGHVCLGGKTPA